MTSHEQLQTYASQAEQKVRLQAAGVGSRGQRRALKKHWKKQPLDVYTDFGLNELTYQAVTQTIGKDRLSQAHQENLMYMVSRFTHFASGYIHKAQGIPKGTSGGVRLAHGLSCGGGKTLSVQAWLSAVSTLGKPYSAAVAMSEIDALVEFKRLLVEGLEVQLEGLDRPAKLSVPEEDIALLHSDASRRGFGAFNSTEEIQRRPFVLTTHAMIGTGDKNLDRFNVYKGKPRSLVLYDESLLVSEGYYLRYADTRDAEYLVSKYYDIEGHDELKPVFEYISSIRKMIEQGAKEADDKGEAVQIKLPSLREFSEGLDEALAKSLFPAKALREQYFHTVRRMIEYQDRDVRVLGKQVHQGAVYFVKKVSDSLKSVFVLDASHHIRQLPRVQATEGVNIVEDPAQARLADPITYPKLTIEWFKSRSGRGYIEAECGSPIDKRPLALKIARWIKDETSPEEKVLIWTFKKGTDKKAVDIPEKLLEVLRKHDIDLERISIETHGRGKGSNKFKDHTAVAFYGVFEPNGGAVAGSMLGQQDDLQGDLSQLDRVLQGEVLHEVYQETSRSAVRQIDKGISGQCKVLLPYYSPRVIRPLWEKTPGIALAWPGCKVIRREDMEEGSSRETPIYAVFVRSVLAYLEDQPADVTKVSSQKVKKELKEYAGIDPKEHRDPWLDAVAFLKSEPEPYQLMEVAGIEFDPEGPKNPLASIAWKSEGRSFLRFGPEDWGFTLEEQGLE